MDTKLYSKNLELADYLAICCGVITCLFSVAINIFIQQNYHFVPISFLYGFIPFGAIISGFVASSGILITVAIIRKSFCRKTFRTAIFIALLTFPIYYYANYIINVVFPANSKYSVFDVISFLKYLHYNITQRVYTSYVNPHNTNPARFGGYIAFALEFLGLYCGGFITTFYLKRITKKRYVFRFRTLTESK